MIEELKDTEKEIYEVCEDMHRFLNIIFEQHKIPVQHQLGFCLAYIEMELLKKFDIKGRRKLLDTIIKQMKADWYPSKDKS